MNYFKALTTMFLFTLLAMPAYGSEIKVEVFGMVCPICSQGLKREIAKLKGVDEKSIQVDMESKIVTFSIDDNVELDKAKLENAVRDAGLQYKGHHAVAKESEAEENEKTD